MSCCAKAPSACIFCRVVFPVVRVDTCCLISGEASTLGPTRLTYHLPIAFQLAFAFNAGALVLKNETIIWPATPAIGGINGSERIPLTSLTVQSHELPPEWSGLTSSWLIHEALNSQPGGRSRE